MTMHPLWACRGSGKQARNAYVWLAGNCARAFFPHHWTSFLRKPGQANGWPYTFSIRQVAARAAFRPTARRGSSGWAKRQTVAR